MKYYVYDIETFKSVFTFSIVREDGVHKNTFQCSKFKNEIESIYKALSYLEEHNFYLVGYNNKGFDYPVLHKILDKKKSFMKMNGSEIAAAVFDIAQKQIDSFKGNQFGTTIKQKEEVVKQVDLYKIHHFDNRAKSTSLKMLEFNMCMDTIEDLPYGIEDELNESQIDELIRYNEHDVEATRKFLLISKPQLDFRKSLTENYKRDFLNHNDGKIGKDYFQMRLEKENVQLYTQNGKYREIRQTRRPFIRIKECLFNYYDFKRPEFIAIYNWFEKQRITETKGVFSDLDESELGEVAKYAEMETKRKKFKSKPSNDELDLFKKQHPLGWVEEEELKAKETLVIDGVKTRVNKKSYWGIWREASCLNIVVDGLRIDFGVGGIHASLVDKIVKETHKYLIRDCDCSSMYPNIAISNRVYPEHLGESFCDIYKDVYEQRKSYPKTAPENAMLKLALNSVYGDSNNKYSVFYDPKYTISITVNGQLSLLLLAEKLLEIEGLKLVQLNTDGLTVAMKRDTEDQYKTVCSAWEKQVGLQLEFADYSKMFIRDVNNYVAVYTNGKVKYKGAYVFKREDLGWHQNHGGLIIPMAACAAMQDGVDLEEFIRNHKNKWDFFLRTKVPRSSKLVQVFDDGEVQLQNICRYYPSTNGGELVKIMPPLSGGTEDRRLSIDKGWKVKVCNDVDNFDFDDINYEYYVNEAKKLMVGVGNKFERIEDETDSED